MSIGARPSWTRRFLRLRVLTAFGCCLPLLLLVAWYTWSAYAELDRYRRATHTNVAIDAELFQIALHDVLFRDLKRLTLPERSQDSKLPTFEISVSRAGLAQLDRSTETGESRYVKALVRVDKKMHEGRVRYRGRRHWHRLTPQKSMKVRINKGDLVADTRVFNLVNDVTPFGLEEQVILDLARSEGLLTPEYHPVWVRLNNAELGVFRFTAQPAEGLLRRSRRMPGSLFSGNIKSKVPQKGVGELFGNANLWAKSAWPVPAAENDRSDLVRLLNAISNQSHGAFRQYVAAEIDLDRFAKLDALDVVFGGDQHDFLSNQKLVFDGYRGRFEPVAWAFRAFRHEPTFNLVENPLLLRLKMIPDYLWRRDQAVYQLLVDRASPPAIRNTVDAAFARLQPDLAADPYWDAYKLLPRVSRFYRLMVRPVTTGQWLLSARAELNTFSQRNRFLLNALEQPSLELHSQRMAKGLTSATLTLGAHAAYRLQRIGVTATCPGTFTVVADVNQNGRWDTNIDRPITSGPLGQSNAPHELNLLLPGIQLVANANQQPKQGTVRTIRVPRAYRYFLRTAPCDPERITLELENLITGATIRRVIEPTPTTPHTPPPAVAPTALPADVPRLVVGERSPHPWSYPRPTLPADLTWGPGPVTIQQTREVQAEQTVHIRPGTTLLLGADVSLVFRGHLDAQGTQAEPISIRPLHPDKPFGGIVLVGPATRGSTLRHWKVTGGSHPQFRAMTTPGLINITETSDITLTDLAISNARDCDDLVHATYVDDLRLQGLVLRDAPRDAVDVELGSAELLGLRIINPGDECIDLMGAKVRVSDSLLLGCHNNGVSAGEETQLTMHGVLVADAKVGVLAKNASVARVSRSLILRAHRALKTNRRDIHYDVPSRIDTQDLFAIDCDRTSKQAKTTRIATAGLRETFPGPSDLPILRRDLLQLDHWTNLEARLAELIREDAP